MRVHHLLPLVGAAYLGLASMAAVAAGENSLTPSRDVSWVQERVEQIQPRPEERKLDQIGWARDIRDAEKLARENNRPIFLFTHDGRMGSGRC